MIDLILVATIATHMPLYPPPVSPPSPKPVYTPPPPKPNYTPPPTPRESWSEKMWQRYKEKK
jgi:hypothetical protein